MSAGRPPQEGAATSVPESGAATTQAPRGSTRSRRLGSLIKFLLAVVLLVWVASGLPWSDTLVYVPDPEDASSTVEVSGSIQGGWREQQVSFRVLPEEVLEDTWPADLRGRVVAGEPLELTRRMADGGGFEWRPGMPRVFLDLRAGGLFSAFAGLILGLCFGVTRWWRILLLAGCPSTWWNTLRLTGLGLFFNLVLPGLTGGDLPKALMVVREHPERRAEALATVVIDRLVGLWSLVLLACFVVWWVGGDFQVLRVPCAVALLGLTLGMVFVLVPGPRRALRLNSLIERLPQAQRIQKLERAALLYRGHAGQLVLSVLFSLGNHLSVIAAVFAIGSAFGTTLDFGSYVGIVSVANLITALPLSPGGWGVGEAAFGSLFQMMGSVATIGVAVSVTYRLCTVAMGLAGGLFMIWPGARRMSREELEAEQALTD